MSEDPSGLPPFPREAWNEGGEDLTSGISGVSEPYSANYEELSLQEEVRDLKSELNGLKIESQLKIHALTHQLDHRDEVEEDLEKTILELKVANEKIEELRQEVMMEKMLHSYNPSMLSNVSSNISSNLSSNISCDDYPPQSRCSDCVELSCALEKRKKEVKDLEVMLKESKDELKKRKLTDSAKKGSLPRKTLFGGNEMVRLEKAKEEIEELKKKLGEKDVLMSKNGLLEQDVRRLEEALAHKDSQLLTLKEEVIGHVSEKKQLHSELECAHEELTCEKTSHQGQLSALWGDFEQEKRELNLKIEGLEKDLRSETARINEEKCHLEKQLAQKLENEKLRRIASESRLQDVLDEKRDVEVSLLDIQDDRNTLQTRLFDLAREKDNLETAKLEAEGVCDEFKDEATKTLGDYNKLAMEHADVAKERDVYREKRDRAMNVITQKNTEIERKDKMLQDLRQRVEKLEKDRDNVVEDLALSREQNKQYQSDFDVERMQRDEEFKKNKKMRHDMQARIDALERSKKELRDELNQKATNRLRSYGPEDYGDYPQPHDRPGYRPGPYP